MAAKTDWAVLLAQCGENAKPAVPQLVQPLDDPQAMTCQRAAYALSEIGGIGAAPAMDGLIRMLDAKEFCVREKSLKATPTPELAGSETARPLSLV